MGKSKKPDQDVVVDQQFGGLGVPNNPAKPASPAAMVANKAVGTALGGAPFAGVQGTGAGGDSPETIAGMESAQQQGLRYWSDPTTSKNYYWNNPGGYMEWDPAKSGEFPGQSTIGNWQDLRYPAQQQPGPTPIQAKELARQAELANQVRTYQTPDRGYSL